MKKIWTLLLCLLTGMCLLTGCEGKKDTAADDADTKLQALVGYSESELQEVLETGYIDTLIAMSEEQLESASEDATIASWVDATEGVGDYEKLENFEAVVDGKMITATANLVFSKREVSMTWTVDVETQTETMSFEKVLTLGEILQKAGMNTLLGMGTVFAVLIFISLIISSFTLIPKIQAAFSKDSAKTEVQKEVKPAPVAAPVAKQEENLVGDTELVAVISAAIAAAEGTSADGFVVRSIKRANSARWKKA